MFRWITIGALAAFLSLAPTAQALTQGSQKKNGQAENGKTEKSKTEKSKAEGVFVAGSVPTSNQTIKGAPYLAGEVRVIVKGEQNPVVRIGLAQTGVTLVEFPEGDKFFAIHPPENGDLVRVEKSPSMRSDHHLVLRAGQDLANASGPAASIMVQMRSGLNVILWIYPVKFVTQQTHRLVISYDRAEIVTARSAAGLAVNLGEERETGGQPLREIAAAAEWAPQGPEGQPSPDTPPAAAPVPEPAENAQSEKDKQEKKENVDAARTVEELKKALREAMADPKSFKKWSAPAHGLSVSTKARDMDEQTRIALVAVKNVEDVPIQILPGHPDLVVETVNKKGKTIQLENVRKRLQEASIKSNVIPARTTVYYAVAFAPPILGNRQRLRVTVGQRNAADDPAGASLTAKAK
ncbi:MAG TPA: hypothetical protein VIM99_17195 [Blastocatellia bacterium]